MSTLFSRRAWTLTCSSIVLLGIFFTPAFSRSEAQAPRASVVITPTAVPSPAPSPAQTHRAIAAAPQHPVVAPPAHEDPRDVFRGLGAWVDLFDFGLSPRASVAHMKHAGVRTLYIETGRTNTADALTPAVYPWLVAAHRAGIKVVGWYLPYYKSPQGEISRVTAIARYNVGGQHFDGLGIDIEFRSISMPPSVWDRNVVALQHGVRAVVGPNYPMAAIVPPPGQMAILPPHWAGFPWAELGRTSDSIMLMSYWTDRVGCPAFPQYCAYGYTAMNVRWTRQLVGARPVVHI
ncbi:MAG: hypothetical protein ABR552_05250, partial [Actinomycetota bacterium]